MDQLEPCDNDKLTLRHLREVGCVLKLARSFPSTPSHDLIEFAIRSPHRHFTGRIGSREVSAIPENRDGFTRCNAVKLSL